MKSIGNIAYEHRSFKTPNTGPSQRRDKEEKVYNTSVVPPHCGRGPSCDWDQHLVYMSDLLVM